MYGLFCQRNKSDAIFDTLRFKTDAEYRLQSKINPKLIPLPYGGKTNIVHGTK